MIVAAFDGRALLVVLVILGLIFWAAVAGGKPGKSHRGNSTVSPGGRPVYPGQLDHPQTGSDLQVWGDSPRETSESAGESAWGQSS